MHIDPVIKDANPSVRENGYYCTECFDDIMGLPSNSERSFMEARSKILYLDLRTSESKGSCEVVQNA